MSHSAEFWCSRRLLVTVDGPQGKSVIPLPRPFARLGREAGSDVVLSSPWVAKRSLYLHATDEGVFCFYLQPEETQTQRLGFWLAPGEPLMVGPYQVSANLEGEPPGPAPALVPLDDWGSVHPPYPVFQVFSDGKLRDKRKFRARLNLIGRRHECALQIKGQQVSAFHGALYWQSSRLWYIDLVSSNGTLLNGAAVDCAEVRLGDRLTVGEFNLLFQRLSKSGGPRSTPRISVPSLRQDADILPADFDDDMPLELDDQLAFDLDKPEPSAADGSAPVIPLEPMASPPPTELAPTKRWQEPPAEATPAALPPEMPAEVPPAQRGAMIPAAAAPVSQRPAPVKEPDVADVAALAPVVQTRQELAVLQRRVEELSKQTAQAGKNAVQHLAQTTHAAFERERQRIAQELERRAGELAKEKLALEAQWQSASRELATQVSQLRDEATLLARQRQAMEQSRLQWDAQRIELERQLRLYAEQLHRLEQGAGPGLPAPAAALPGAAAAAMPEETADRLAIEGQARLGHSLGETASVEENEAATAMVLAAAGQGGALRPRSHVVDAHVESISTEYPNVGLPHVGAPYAGLPHVGQAQAALPSPVASSPADLDRQRVLEGSLAPQAAVTTLPTQAPPAAAENPSPARTIRGRKTSKGKDAFGEVTDRMVEMEQGRRNSMVVLGIAISAAVVVLAAAIVVTAVLLR